MWPLPSLSLRSLASIVGGARSLALARNLMTLLEVEDLRILLRRGKQEIALVDGVSLTVAPGSVVGLAGESGSGKTLTGLSALGFLPDRSRATGWVRFERRHVLAMNPSQLR